AENSVNVGYHGGNNGGVRRPGGRACPPAPHLVGRSDRRRHRGGGRGAHAERARRRGRRERGRRHGRRHAVRHHLRHRRRHLAAGGELGRHGRRRIRRGPLLRHSRRHGRRSARPLGLGHRLPALGRAARQHHRWHHQHGGAGRLLHPGRRRAERGPSGFGGVRTGGAGGAGDQSAATHRTGSDGAPDGRRPGPHDERAAQRRDRHLGDPPGDGRQPAAAEPGTAQPVGGGRVQHLARRGAAPHRAGRAAGRQHLAGSRTARPRGGQRGGHGQRDRGLLRFRGDAARRHRGGARRPCRHAERPRGPAHRL
ncbi:MAG: hypothetical protein AVDCRST_MAG08-2411, partial [uncultured Acetobacteraceae bacterium]